MRLLQGHNKIAAFLQIIRGGYFKSFLGDLRSIFDRNEDGRSQSRRNILAATTLSNVVLGATSGVFYTGLMRIVLAEETTAVQNSYLGLLVSLNILFQLTQFLAPYAARLFRSWRSFVLCSKLCCMLIQGVVICVIPFLPFAPVVKAGLIVAFVGLAQVAASLPSPLISVWHIANVPIEMRTNWFAAQSMVNSLCTMCASLLYSFLIDRFALRGIELYGLLLIRVLSLIPAGFELRAYGKIRLPEDSGINTPPSILAAFSVFRKAKPYLCITLICALWGFISAVPGLYYTNYLLGKLGFQYTLISLCTILYLPFMLVMMPFWSNRIQEHGMLRTLGQVLLLYLVPFAMYLLVTRQTSYLYVLGVLMVHCISPAVSLVFSNLPYQHLPVQQQVGCLALHNSVCFLASFLGSLTGKTFMRAADSFEIQLKFGTIGPEQMLYGLSIVIAVGLAVYVLSLDAAWRKRDNGGRGR